MEYAITQLMDLSHSMAGDYLRRFSYPWQALEGISHLIRSLGKNLGEDYQEISPEVWVHRTAFIAPSAFLGAPCIIGPRTEVRHCAFIRGSALIGEDCVVGNSTEVKNAILFDHVEIPHYNYVGDSILGFYAHMGAGSVTSNVKSDRSNVTVCINGVKTDSGRYKFGAVLGDRAEIGCNSVLNPGTIVGKNTSVYPASCVRGVIPSNSIYKTGGIIVSKI